ncbi:MAG: carbon storage regulator [Candidatus Eremiobacteraeota bacterium]|nr:carbon storage regulator [Candidatus Eremiobacteraeota bacterium]MBC5801910.1 carbon storage regulator [Candidatus Eremiobacteraeota bacterium]MBC5821743.1 carbon storage regulator [Candidatus Eremiobacteraeota bacterium]
MLILRRKVGQGVTIGDDIRVVVVAVDGDGVRLGIEAPRDVPVRRAEQDESEPFVI